MKFADLAVSLMCLEDASLIKKPDALEKLLAAVPIQSLAQVVTIVAGAPLTDHPHRPSRTLIQRALAAAAGRSVGEVRIELRRIGDLPRTAEELLAESSQKRLVRQMATLEEALHRIEELLLPSTGSRSTSIGLTSLLSRCGPAGACLALSILLGESHAYVSEFTLLEAVSGRLSIHPETVNTLVREKGWRDALIGLTKRLSGASQTVVRRPCNGEEGWKNGTQEGNT